MDRNKDGYAALSGVMGLVRIAIRLTRTIRLFGIFWKFARVGERLSPYVSLCCVIMAVSISNREYGFTVVDPNVYDRCLCSLDHDARGLLTM